MLSNTGCALAGLASRPARVMVATSAIVLGIVALPSWSVVELPEVGAVDSRHRIERGVRAHEGARSVFRRPSRTVEGLARADELERRSPLRGAEHPSGRRA